MAQDQAGTVIGGSMDRSRPQAPCSRSRDRVGMRSA